MACNFLAVTEGEAVLRLLPVSETREGFTRIPFGTRAPLNLQDRSYAWDNAQRILLCRILYLDIYFSYMRRRYHDTCAKTHKITCSNLQVYIFL